LSNPIVVKVFDNINNKLFIPTEVGIPCEHQFKGSEAENLVELSGRVCYDSVGIEKTRSTDEYHKHILEVKHHSVLAHFNFTTQFPSNTAKSLRPEIYALSCLNRPGVYISCDDKIRITANLRSIIEWDQWHNSFVDHYAQSMIGWVLKYWAREQCPIIFKNIYIPTNITGIINDENLKIIYPVLDEEIWVSFFISNVSRSLTHELCRHGYRTAISQRSTRYVDESESEWSWHPLILKYKDEILELTHSLDGFGITGSCFTIENLTKPQYNILVSFLQDKLMSEGLDKFSARKQARGAARGILGNALSTELIFSASLTQWERIILQRCNNAADAEIRVMISHVFDILTTENYLNKNQYDIQTAKDGFGYHIVKTN